MTVQELYTEIGGDYANACKRLMNDSLISRFIAKFPAEPSFEKLTVAAAAGDMTGVFEAAHALKGVTANLAITSIAELAGEITEATRSGSDASQFPLEQKMAELTERYTKAVTAIKVFCGQA